MLLFILLIWSYLYYVLYCGIGQQLTQHIRKSSIYIATLVKVYSETAVTILLHEY